MYHLRPTYNWVYIWLKSDSSWEGKCSVGKTLYNLSLSIKTEPPALQALATKLLSLEPHKGKPKTIASALAFYHSWGQLSLLTEYFWLCCHLVLNEVSLLLWSLARLLSVPWRRCQEYGNAWSRYHLLVSVQGSNEQNGNGSKSCSFWWCSKQLQLLIHLLQ